MKDFFYSIKISIDFVVDKSEHSSSLGFFSKILAV